MERPDNRLIRVFLSSTFVDFQEERSLLVQQVFPSLRRRARSREVEIVDVDLRWGVTAEQTERGETLPLCLGEIDRCRPYFISLLGERYGWVPPPDYYKPELLERQPWLKERMGGASVTELEILHGVLRNPEMAGHAFFYLRDPAYAQAQSEPGWVAENPAERQRLEALKAQIRASGFPVAEGLPSPQAIAERIEADLWQLIESRFPEQEPADALEREDRRHSDYRRARTGLYLGGGPAIEQLERWITEGEQRILITGDSGAGKSALIANWMEAHQRNHPQDLVHAHHLGCTNDASAVRPLLGRLIDTASKLLLQEQQISEAIQVPQDWWELVFKVGEVFALLSPWCERQGRRWILVLDGLDRLAEEDQQALPWIPITIPPGIHVVASALDCPARSILQERQYRTHEIGPLGKAEQQQLIERYLSRYTKQLESGLQQRILAHALAGSPLFLRVLLEELRQCGRFEMLEAQIADYIKPNADGSLAVNDLYARVLARLESDCGAEPVRKALTALWASRAGLSEPELLENTGLAPVDWAPIDLALENSFRRNGNRLVFDHEYLRKAVENRYLPTEEHRRQAHSELADWYVNKEEWDARKSEEMPWQLLRGKRYSDLKAEIVQPKGLIGILKHRDEVEYAFLFRESDAEAEVLINATTLLLSRRSVMGITASLLDSVSALIEYLFPGSNTLLDSRRAWVAACSAEDAPIEVLHRAKHCLANALKDNGQIDEAIEIYRELIEAAKEQSMSNEKHACALEGMALAFWADNDSAQAEALFRESISQRLSLFGRNHPVSIRALNNFATSVLAETNRYDEAIEILEQNYQEQVSLHGSDSLDCLTTANNLSMVLFYANQSGRAAELARTSLRSLSKFLPVWSDQCMRAANNLAVSLFSLGDVDSAVDTLCGALSNAMCGSTPTTIAALCENAWFNHEPGRTSTSSTIQLLRLCLNACVSCKTIDPQIRKKAYLELVKAALSGGEISLANEVYLGLVDYCKDLSREEESEALYLHAEFLSQQGRHADAIPLRRRELAWCRQQNGDSDPGTLTSINGLAIDLRETGALEESEDLFRELISARQQVLAPNDFDIGRALGGLAKTLEQAGRPDEAVDYARQCLEHRIAHEGPDSFYTNRNRLDLARILHKLDRQPEALELLDELQSSLNANPDKDDDDLDLLSDASELRGLIEIKP